MRNEELIKKVIDNIDKTNRWNQAHWGRLGEQHYDADGDVRPETWEGFEPALGFVWDAEDHVLMDIQVVKDGACKTSFCFAGHTVLVAGDSILLNKDTGDSSHCLDKDGNVHLIEERARHLLGLSLDEADLLFDGSIGDHDFNRYKAIVSHVTGVDLPYEETADLLAARAEADECLERVGAEE